MNKKRLGQSAIWVSDLCMGTMTMGAKNTESESFAILDRCLDAGITFYDTAEIYPVPPKAEHIFRSEEIVGKWLKTKSRDAIILATKVAGSGHTWFNPPLRAGHTGLDRRNIRTAIEGSLQRLQTDYIDLYQTHWPDHDLPYEETLQVLSELVDEGKVRIIGSSNESAWGSMRAEWVADQNGFCRYETIQNNYSIINRRFEDGLADICRRQKISCLPYSPLAGGVCSGKYNGPQPPQGARFTDYIQKEGERQKQMAHRFVNEASLASVADLMVLAADLSITVAQLSLAWCRQQDFVGSVIFGATSLEQLADNLGAADVTLSQETRTAIDDISRAHPYPLG